MLKVKRVYEPPSADDGVRILVDRLWPRGLTKEAVHAETWEKELAPSNGLRTWYAHDPAKWDEFRRRYRKELEASGMWDELMRIAARARREDVTLLYGSKERERNQAVALKEMALGR